MLQYPDTLDRKVVNSRFQPTCIFPLNAVDRSHGGGEFPDRGICLPCVECGACDHQIGIGEGGFNYGNAGIYARAFLQTPRLPKRRLTYNTAFFNIEKKENLL
jgi:hypothetical protein